VAAGDRRRLTPQLAWYNGPDGPVGGARDRPFQVVRSTVTGRRRSDLTHRAWQVAAAWVLTGEPRTDRGVKPARPFDPKAAAAGAPGKPPRAPALFAPTRRRSTSGAADPERPPPPRPAPGPGGLNVVLDVAKAKVQLNLTRDRPSTAAPPAGTDRRVERAFFTRAQVSF
jgi:hypothetical protein